MCSVNKPEAASPALEPMTSLSSPDHPHPQAPFHPINKLLSRLLPYQVSDSVLCPLLQKLWRTMAKLPHRAPCVGHAFPSIFPFCVLSP